MPPIVLDDLRADTARVLGALRKRLARRVAAIRGDLQRIDEARELARIAALATPTIARVPRGSRSVRVLDFATDTEHLVALDPARAPRDSLEKFFSNARRLKNGAHVAETRLREAESSVATLDALLAEGIAAAETEDALVLLRARAKLPSPKKRDAKPKQEPKPPFRTFRNERGVIWVGRGAAKNDELTFRVAKPYHLWLHARGFPGAHVVVQLKRDQDCPSELLVDAAHLAAHFSDARGELTVEVTYVPRKFVRKPKGSAPGAVVATREKVLTLRFDVVRAARLLSCEVE